MTTIKDIVTGAIERGESSPVIGITQADLDSINVRFIIGQHAYAVITWPNGAQMDIQLAPGQSAQKALEQYAREQARISRDALRKAHIARIAAYKESNQ